MFEHPEFTLWEPDELPRNRDCFLMDEKYMGSYENYMLECFRNGGTTKEPPGFVSYIAVRNVELGNIVLSWFTNVIDRFHETDLKLPKHEIVICVGAEGWSERPHIFVNSQWLRTIYMQQNSIFALIDAGDMKRALQEGRVSRDQLIRLRSHLDEIAKKHKDVLFLSFADTVILKTNWTVGSFNITTNYTYSPKRVLSIIDDVAQAFQKNLDMDSYAIVTQGSNEYYDDPLFSNTQVNHISLNSLGTPFANLKFIEDSVRNSGKTKHGKYQIYLDSFFFHSLNVPENFAVNTNKREYSYKSKVQVDPKYYCFNREELKNVE